MIRFLHKGDFKNTEKLLEKMKKSDVRSLLNSYGQKGVIALATATPVDTGTTAAAWDYTISNTNGSWSIIWTNSNVNKGVNIAVILQYGHGTRNGGYVQGIDYINPALKPIFDEIAEAAWKEVTGS